MSDGISTATRGAIFEVTIDRPKANAIDLAASRRLNQVLKADGVVHIDRRDTFGDHGLRVQIHHDLARFAAIG